MVAIFVFILCAQVAGLIWVLLSTRRSVYIYQVNQMNSRSDFGHSGSTVNIVMVIIIIMCISCDFNFHVPCTAFGIWYIYIYIYM